MHKVDKRVIYYRNRKDKDDNSKYLESFAWEWYKPSFLDIHVLFPLLERLKDINYILNESYYCLLVLLRNHSQQNELENALQWFESEKSKIESQLKKDGQKIVNLESVLDDHFDKKETKTQSRLKNLLRR